MPSPLTKSELAYEESLIETEEALANTSLLQLSPAPSLNLTSLQLQSVVESLSSNLCFLDSMLVASIVKSDRFQLWSFQLTTAQLCSSAEESLQQKELAAAYAFMAQFQDSPTRARQLQLSTAQLCRQQSTEESLQQKELAAAYCLMAQSECSMRACQLITAQLCRIISSFQAADPRTVVRKAAFQETGTAFQTGAFRSIPFRSAAFKTLVSAISSLNLHSVCLTSFQGEFQQLLQDPASAITTINAEKLPYPSRRTTNCSRKRVDELEETNNFAAMGQELAKYIANLREISQTFSPKTFRELEVLKDNFPQKPDLDACQVELGNSELDIDACQVELGNSELDIDACQVELGNSELDIDACQVELGNSELDLDACQAELGNSQLDTENFDQLTLKEPLGRRNFRKATSKTAAWQKRASDRQLLRQQLGRRELQTGNFSDSSLAEESFRQATSQTAAWKKRPSERQLQRQQLGRRELQTGNFSDSSLEKEIFRKATSETAAWQKRASDRQLLRQQLANLKLGL